MRARCGFSLLELLVSVSVVLVLAALLLPVISKARQAVQRTQCLSQMRQLGLAFREYAEAFDGSLPHEDNGDTQPPFGCGWYEVLTPYLGPRASAGDCRQCPALSVDPAWRSYKMNSLLEEGAVAFRGLEPMKNPDNTVLAFDGRVDKPGLRTLPKGDWDSAAPRHGAGSVCLFCDGHVAFHPARFDDAGWDGESGLAWRP